MRLVHLEVANFKGLRDLTLDNLEEVVVLAGPNGCGKSAALDAIRLLKSSQGGYDRSEWQWFFGEFQINMSRRSDLEKLFRDNTKPIHMVAQFSLGIEEFTYLCDSAEFIVEPVAWREIAGRDIDNVFGVGALAADIREYGDQVARRTKDLAAELRAAADGTPRSIELEIRPDLTVVTPQDPVLGVMFQVYDPTRLGVIEYHSSLRAYQRETLGGVNLNVEGLSERRKQHSLYNWQNKYQNVKSELAAAYVRELIAEKAGVPTSTTDLNETLVDLFRTFFPDKSYNGPQPQSDGSVSFPVTLTDGCTHDIDDLSSGEKEILYGYLRLRSTSPRNSVILIDEPELHLNPGLLQGLPDFYHRNLGRAFNNQIWLVTHSDALLRQSVGQPSFSVFHMTPATAQGEGNQASRIEVVHELDSAIVDLVGDLATYKPWGKVVILEGGGSDFDVSLTSRLFPEFAAKVNLISGGGKKRVRGLYDFLNDAAPAMGTTTRFFAVVDRDAKSQVTTSGAAVLEWDRYHIENYLLEPSFVREAANTLAGSVRFRTNDEVDSALEACATDMLNRLVMERLQLEVNDDLVGSISVRGDPAADDPAVEVRPSIEGSASRLNDVGSSWLSGDRLRLRALEIRRQYEALIPTGGWRTEMPGRRILSCFVDRHATGVNYEAFRNLLVEKMADAGFRPEGMERVLSTIVETNQRSADDQDAGSGRMDEGTIVGVGRTARTRTRGKVSD